MAVLSTIQFWDNEGNELEGPREDGTSLVHEFDHRVYLPFDKEQTLIEGSRKIAPLNVVKYIDRLSPQLIKMACEGKKCEKVVLTLYRINRDDGNEEPYFTYTLENANIVSVENSMLSTKTEDTEAIDHLEKVGIVARKWEWEYLDGGISHPEEAF